jgi:hypothetical protein
VALERSDDVCRRQFLAVVEGHALAHLEGPGLGVVGGAIFFRQPIFDLAGRRDLEQLLTPAATECVRHLACPSRGIEAVGGGTADQTSLQQTALHRALRSRGTADEGICKGGTHAERGGAAEKVAARQAAACDMTAEKLEFAGHTCSHCCVVGPISSVKILRQISRLDQRVCARRANKTTCRNCDFFSGRLHAASEVSSDAFFP